MSLVDTHCHIQSAGLEKGERSTRELWAKAGDTSVEAIVERARAAGVEQMVCVGCDLADSQLAVDCVHSREGLYASIGIHPHEAQHYVGQTDKLDTFAALAAAKKVVAVGECGLDYFYEHSPREAQIEILKFQLDLAIQHNFPVIFHVREAYADFWPIFERYPKGAIRGVLHSFTDDVENLQRALSHGLYIGVNGIATFAKPDSPQCVMYNTIPLGSLLLETDSPFLTPTPYRGTVNEPKHIRTIAEFLETTRGDSFSDIVTATTNNAVELFRLPGA